MKLHCSQCHNEVPEGKKFCPSCGTKVNIEKTNNLCICGKELDPLKKFCTSCGAPNHLFIPLPAKSQEPEKPLQSSTHCECGAEYPEIGKFCVKCGKPVPIAITKPPEVVSETPKVPSTPIVSVEKTVKKPTPVVQSPVQKPIKKKSSKKFLKFAAVFLLVCVIGVVGLFAYEMFFGGIRKKLLVEQTIVPGEEDQIVKYEDDISVTVPFGLIDTEEKLSISSVKGLPNSEGLKMLDAYEVKVTNVSEIDGFIEVTMKYDPSKIPSGMSASRALTCMYYNETSSAWEAVPYMINESAQQITVYTPHLSIFAYGAAEEIIKPGPMMKVAVVPFPAGNMLDEKKMIELLELYGGPGNASSTEQGMLEGWALVSEWFGITSTVFTFAEDALEVGALQGCNQIMSEVGLGFALIQAAIDFSNGNKNKAVFELARNISNYMVLKFINTAAVNVACVGVFVIEYSLNKFTTTAISGRNQIYTDAYNLYYNEKRAKENIDAVWWYKKLKSLARKTTNPATSGDVIKKFIHDYVWEFWRDETVVAAYMDRITKGHGFTGGGGLNEALKTDLSNNHLFDIVNVLNKTGIFERVIKELRIEAQGKLHDQLVSLQHQLNIEYPIKIIVKQDPDCEDYDNVSLSGLNVRFVTSNPVHKDLWTGKTDRNGEMEFRCTALGYVDAGVPNIIEVEVPSPADKDKVEVFSGEMSLGSSGKLTVVEIMIGAPLLEGVWKVQGTCTFAKLDASFGAIDEIASAYDYVMYGSKGNYDAARKESEKAMIGQKADLPELDLNTAVLLWKVQKDGKYYIIESPTFANEESLGGSKYKIQFTDKNTFEGFMESTGRVGGRTNHLKYDVKGTRIR